MNKAQWYRHLFERIKLSIEKEYFFEAAFISYGIIEDRLTSILNLIGLKDMQGVSKKVSAISKNRSTKLESAFGLNKWNGSKYVFLGLLGEVLTWGELYRNPIQHILGDPRKYNAKFGGFHVQNTKDMALDGEEISRKLSSAVMRYKKL
jgi:hypothetical protein